MHNLLLQAIVVADSLSYFHEVACFSSGEQWFLGEEDLQCVAIGAGIMGCGGGGDPYIGQLQARRKLIEGKTITIVNPCRSLRTV